MDWQKLQSDHLEWATKNFPKADPAQVVLGVCEEAGELAHAQLKLMQGIRGDKLCHQLEMRDAIADIVLYLLHLCDFQGWDFERVVNSTWQIVKQRNWVLFPTDGRTK